MKSLGNALVLVVFAMVLAIGDRAWSAPQPGTPTFNRDIAPIVFKNCAVCHRPGESAPFSLLTFRDLKKHAAQVAEVTKSRFMPPWLPQAGYGEFVGERRLSDEQISLIQRWVDAGAEEGEAADLPPTPAWRKGWQLGEPDLVIRMEQSYTLRASGRDVYRNFVIPIPLTNTRYVEAVELRPGNKRVVHHANILIDPTRSSRILDEKDSEPGFEGMDFFSEAQRPGGYFLTWVPGTLPSVEPTPWRLDPRSSLVINMHMLPSGKDEVIEPAVGFHFTDKPAQGPLLYIFKLEGDEQIDIPPGRKHFSIADDYTLPVDVEVLGVDPHAHFLGKTMQGFATLPDGTKKWLIRIDDWDFNWQDVYRFLHPVFLPKGSIVSMRYTYDNSSDNGRNPSSPPKHVVAGNSTLDEMGHLWVQFQARDREGLKLLELGQALHILEKYPNNAMAHYNVGRHHHLERRYDRAIHHYEQALRSRPAFALAHHNLGSVLRRMGRLDEAIRHYKAALKFRPQYAPAHDYLARTLHSNAQMTEAISHYRETLKLNPDNLAAHYRLAAAHHELGATLQKAGRAAEALQHYRRSLELKDDSPMTLTRAAWLLATTVDDNVRSPTDAVTLASRASELTGHGHPAVEDTLAVAYAAAGDFDRAVATAKHALELITDPGHEKAIQEIRRHLELFRNKTPFMEESQ